MLILYFTIIYIQSRINISIYSSFGTGSFSFSRLISGISPTFNTQFDLEQVSCITKMYTLNLLSTVFC